MALPARRTAGRHRVRPASSSATGPPISATRLITPGPVRQDPAHRAQAWLRNAMAALAILATAAAVVSWQAQYVLVWSVKHTTSSPPWRRASPTSGRSSSPRSASRSRYTASGHYARAPSTSGASGSAWA